MEAVCTSEMCSHCHNQQCQTKLRGFKNCAFLGYYAARSGNFLPTFRDNLSLPFNTWPIGCPETSVITQTIAVIIYLAAETWSHVLRHCGFRNALIWVEPVLWRPPTSLNCHIAEVYWIQPGTRYSSPAGLSGAGTPLGSRDCLFSTLVQTNPRTHPACRTVSTVDFFRRLTTPPPPLASVTKVHTWGLRNFWNCLTFIVLITTNIVSVTSHSFWMATDSFAEHLGSSAIILYNFIIVSLLHVRNVCRIQFRRLLCM
jgi:hypothetical protein